MDDVLDSDVVREHRSGLVGEVPPLLRLAVDEGEVELLGHLLNIYLQEAAVLAEEPGETVLHRVDDLRVALEGVQPGHRGRVQGDRVEVHDLSLDVLLLVAAEHAAAARHALADEEERRRVEVEAAVKAQLVDEEVVRDAREGHRLERVDLGDVQELLAELHEALLQHATVPRAVVVRVREGVDRVVLVDHLRH